MDVSVVLSTYNRCEVLARALERLASQEAAGIEYEVIVVDNNSSDNTRQVAEGFAARDGRFRYLFEGRQGLSHARNAGIGAAQAEAIAFTDDDVEAAGDWILQIHKALLRYPEAEFVGGRVLAAGDTSFPAWAHAKMGPFALQDLGDKPVMVNRSHRRCLIGACLAIRARSFSKAGLFSTATQRVEDGVGSTEDADWEAQVWNRGGHGMYVPDIVVHSPLSKERLIKAYHRRWHLGHGKFNARGRRPELETARRWLDVPAFMYRQAVESAIHFAMLAARGRRAEAFERENALLFCMGYAGERWRTHLTHLPGSRRPAQANSLAG
ncbi:MAG: glycosyltransferase family 2 protein [Acidobacteriaceae bacterium]|nr:glycosyltransferase family 2 protein [Acidobacteriaceae bacterium]